MRRIVCVGLLIPNTDLLVSVAAAKIEGVRGQTFALVMSGGHVLVKLAK